MIYCQAHNIQKCKIYAKYLSITTQKGHMGAELPWVRKMTRDSKVTIVAILIPGKVDFEKCNY